MSLNLINKNKLINKYCIQENYGSVVFQIILLTYKINKLHYHFLKNKKDLHSKQGLLKIVFKRRKLLIYLKNKNINIYNNLFKDIKFNN